MARFKIEEKPFIITPQGQTLPFFNPAVALELWLMWDDLGYPYKSRLGFRLFDGNGQKLYEDSAYHALMIEGEDYKNWTGDNNTIITLAAQALDVVIVEEIVPEEVVGEPEEEEHE